jgi:hypothetical protein
VLVCTAARIRKYAGNDAELLALASALERESEEYSERVFDAVELKRAHFAGYAAQSARSPEGRARRAPRP